MAPKTQPAWQIYKEQMEYLCYGDALWEPAPTSKYTRVNIGDVGFIRGGRFHLLFSAGSPLGERKLGYDVPSTFEQLEVGTPESDQPRRPGCVGTPTVQQVGADTDATIPATPPLQPGANFSFELTGERGAALVTRYPTYKEDTQLDTAFKEYTVQHYKSWVKFARDKKYGDNLKPVLVSGFDITRDFAMVTYSDGGTSVRSNTTLSIPMFGSVSASSWGTWRARFTPHINHGPQQCVPPSRVDALSSPPAASESHSTEFNQCVFIRYYTMRLGLFPKVIRANAGPHDLGSGENRGDTLPEVMSRSDAETTATGGEGLTRQLNHPADSDANADLEMVVHNVPHEEEYDSWDAIADYVFQNSHATSVLMHHLDLAEIRKTGEEGSISFLLEVNEPRIVVDKDGVGRIISGSRETSLRSQAALTRSIPDESQGEEVTAVSDCPQPTIRTLLIPQTGLQNDAAPVHYPLDSAGASPSVEVLSWTSKDPRQSQLLTSWGVRYRFQTDTSGSGRSVTHLFRAIRPTIEKRVATLEWASNGGLGRAIIWKTVVPMADLVRQDPRAPGWRIFNGPDGYSYKWGPSPSNGGDVILQDPNNHIIAHIRSVAPTRYNIGDVYRELHFIPSAGAGVVMHPPFMDIITVTAMLYLFVNAWGI